MSIYTLIDGTSTKVPRVNAQDLKSCEGFPRVGSSPTPGKEAAKRSEVRTGFPVEELRELLQELSQELSRNYDEPSCHT